LNIDYFSEFSNDFLALLVTVAIVAAYQLYLRHLARLDSSAVLSTFAAEARSAWVESMMSAPDNSLIAIHTLRNSTMAATFLASTAVLLMVGVMTLTGQSPALKETWHALNFVGTLRPEVWLVKLLTMLIVLFFTFFCFSNAIRIFNHVGYLINVRDSISGNCRYSATLVASELSRGGRFFSFGIRAYYYLVPLVCWLFGPLYMVGSAIILVTVMLPWVDRVPVPKELREH
jgi:uncharacterized membrane protein